MSNLAPLVGEILTEHQAEAMVLDPSQHSIEQAQQLKKAAFLLADVALATSGTVSLEISAAGLPMVIAYRANLLTEFLIKRLARIDTATLANIITDRKAIPEFLFADCEPDAIADELQRLLQEPERADAQKEASSAALKALGRGGEAPGLRAAKSVLNFLKR